MKLTLPELKQALEAALFEGRSGALTIKETADAFEVEFETWDLLPISFKRLMAVAEAIGTTDFDVNHYSHEYRYSTWTTDTSYFTALTIQKEPA